MDSLRASATTGLWRRVVVAAVAVTLGAWLAGTAYAGQETFNADGTFTTPAGVNTIKVEAWGGGGAGGYSATKTTGATGGGGGGAYARSTLTVTPSTGYPVTIGAGGTATVNGAPTNGGNTIFGSNLVIAVGGTSNTVDNVSGVAGGQAASCTMTGTSNQAYSGGNGGNGLDNPNGGGGGGGSSAGNAANGVVGGNASGGVGGAGGTAPAGGGNGGAGISAAGGAGSAGFQPGGGGGGSLRTGGAMVGGGGAAGRVIVNYGPTVTINQAGGQSDPTNTSPVTFDVVFSEDVTGFTTADVALAGTATGKSVTNVSGSGTTYTVTVSATGGGTIIATIPAGGIQDLFGNNNFASTSTDNTITYTTAAKPTVTINQDGGQADPTNGTILYTVIFSENVTGFDATDVSLSGTAVASVTNVSGGPATYTVTVTATDSGTVIADIPADAATGSSSGLTNVASTSTDNTVTFDNLKPTASIDLADGQADPELATGAVNFKVTFVEASGSVTGFDSSDVVVSGTSTGAAVSAVTGGPLVYNVAVLGSINGTIIINVPADAAQDAAGNTSTAATVIDNEIDYQGGTCVDPSPSTLTITYDATPSPGGDPALFGPTVDLTALFSSSNLTGFTYTIDGNAVESPWNSSAYGTTGEEILSFTVQATDPDCGGVLRSDTGSIKVNNSSLNYLVHNSETTGSDKWPTTESGDVVNGWGITNAQYGKFTCATCHDRNTSNIKRIKTAITAPNTEGQGDSFPGSAVVFLSAQEGSSHYGDDTVVNRPLGANASNRICEVCHSKNHYHNYDTANNNGGNNHANKSDCIDCHKHNEGFKAPGCNSCHGNPPVSSATMVFTPAPTGALADPVANSGVHARHVTTKGMDCLTCHKGNTMPESSTTIEMGFEASNATVPGWGSNVNNTVTGGTIDVPLDSRLLSRSAAGYTFVSSDVATTVNKVDNDNFTCNIYCHGNWPGAAGLGIPSWVGAPLGACSTSACHGTTGANVPTTGSHIAHADNSGLVKLACAKCHEGYTDTVHVDGNVKWSLATGDSRIGATATYRGAAIGNTDNHAPSATYGDCSNVYCHGSGVNVTWGDNGTIFCNSCHAASNTLEGRHGTHHDSAVVVNQNSTANASTATNYVFGCGTCHDPSSTSHAGGTVSAVQAAEVILNAGGTYTAAGSEATTSPDAAGGFVYTSGTCGSNACHQNGRGGAPNAIANWTGTLPTDCTGCHNNNAASGTPMASNAHGVHVSDATVMSIKPCQMCHDATVDSNDQAVTDKSRHANAVKDIAILNTWDSDANPDNNWNGTSCSNVYCHSNGQAIVNRSYQTIDWTTTIGCTGCHGGAGTTTTLTGAHLTHIGTDPSDTNKQFVYTCNVCHVQTAASNSAIAVVDNHINTVRDVAISNSFGGTGTNDSNYVGYVITNDLDPRFGVQALGTCATTNCHGTDSIAWFASGTTGNCSLCHGMAIIGQTAPNIQVYDTSGQTSDGDPQVGSHSAHINGTSNYSAPITCDQCHFNTFNNMSAQSTYVGKVKAAGHIDSSAPAEISYGSVATAGGATVVYNAATRTCSNYCHGATLSTSYDKNPGWNQNSYLNNSFTFDGDCNRCHLSPPSVTGHTGSETLDQCGQCHDETMTEGVGNAFLDKTKHIDGTIQVSTTCGSCHGQLPPATGSHPKHGIHLGQDMGFVNNVPGLADPLLGELSNWTASNYPTCSACHDMTTQDKHLDYNVVNEQIVYINSIMGPNKPDEAFAWGYPVANQAGYPVYNDPIINGERVKSCSNARCHFKPTPDWNPGGGLN